MITRTYIKDLRHAILEEYPKNTHGKLYVSNINNFPKYWPIKITNT